MIEAATELESQRSGHARSLVETNAILQDLTPLLVPLLVLPAHTWTDAWIYFIAPPLGMLLAAEIYRRLRGEQAVLCCKLHHENDSRCIFRCRYH